MSSKIDRALYGPSLTEVVIGAVLSVLIGAVLAAAWLVFKPVETVGALPKEPVAGQVYYIEGSNSSAKGRQWLRKRQLFAEGVAVSVNEDELNAAVSSLAPPTGKQEEEKGMVVPGALNFRIHDNQLQIAAPVEVNVAGFMAKVQVSADGIFEQHGGKYVYVPEKLYVGSCPVERLPVVPGLIFSRLMKTVTLPDDLTAAWDKLNHVAIDGTRLQLGTP